jgi:predicted signal transduction protein with EAL and GGDEF domain
VILPRTDAEAAHRVASELLHGVRDHDAFAGGRTVRVTTSIGVATFGEEQVTGQEVLATADIAMYEAKNAGRDRVCALDNTTGGAARERARTSWIERIREALEQDRFVLQAQPILNLATDEISQHELLLRMVSETGEIVPPAAFLSTAERFGLVQSIDRWVVQRADPPDGRAAAPGPAAAPRGQHLGQLRRRPGAPDPDPGRACRRRRSIPTT